MPPPFPDVALVARLPTNVLFVMWLVVSGLSPNQMPPPSPPVVVLLRSVLPDISARRVRASPPPPLPAVLSETVEFCTISTYPARPPPRRAAVLPETEPPTTVINQPSAPPPSTPAVFPVTAQPCRVTPHACRGSDWSGASTAPPEAGVELPVRVQFTSTTEPR